MKQSEELSAICFDEINTSDLGDLDVKYDTFIPPNKLANMLFVRSLINADLKMPVYILNNGAYEKVLLFDVIYVLENVGLKILSQTFDQGPRDRALSKSLNITTKNVVFINPAGREMVSMNDWVHEVKNLRNSELDDTIFFPQGCFHNVRGGLYVTPTEHLEELKSKTNKITDKHIKCVTTDCQGGLNFMKMSRPKMQGYWAFDFGPLEPLAKYFQPTIKIEIPQADRIFTK